MNQIHTAGSRKIDAFNFKADKMAEEFIPSPDFNPFEAVNILKKIGTSLPRERRWSNTLIRQIEIMVKLTRKEDWQKRKPVVWMSVAKIAVELDISPSQVSKNERRLLELGAITFIDSGNYKRFGKRDREGKIHGYGINLAPLGTMLFSLRSDLANITEIRAKKDQLRYECSAIRRKIRGVLCFMMSNNDDDERISILGKAFEQLLLANKTRHNSSHHQFNCFHQELVAFYERLIREENQHNKKEKTEIMRTKDSDNADISPHSCGAHIIQKDNLEIKTGKKQPLVSINHNQQSPNTNHPVKGHEGSRSQISDSHLYADVFEQEEKAEQEALERCFSLRHFINGLPDDLKQGLPLKPGWRNIAILSDGFRHEMGISNAAWRMALQILGSEAACMSMIIVYLRWREGIVFKPGGYFRGMIKKARTGDLHLMPSIFGLMSVRSKGRA